MGPTSDTLLDISRSFNDLALTTSPSDSTYFGSHDLDDIMGKGIKYNVRRRARTRHIPQFIPDKQSSKIFHPTGFNILNQSPSSNKISSTTSPFMFEDLLPPKSTKLRHFPSSEDEKLQNTSSIAYNPTQINKTGISNISENINETEKTNIFNRLSRNIQNFCTFRKNDCKNHQIEKSQSNPPSDYDLRSEFHTPDPYQPSFSFNRYNSSQHEPYTKPKIQNKINKTFDVPPTLLNQDYKIDVSPRTFDIIEPNFNTNMIPTDKTRITYDHYNLYPEPSFAENANQVIRVIFNLCIVSGLIFILFSAYYSVIQDIRNRISTHNRNLSEGILECRNKYFQNNCNVTPRVPVLEISCRDFERCMNQDPNMSGELSNLSAKLLGEIINTFIEQLNWRTIAILTIVFLTVVIGSNWALSLRPKNLNNPTFYHKPPHYIFSKSHSHLTLPNTATETMEHKKKFA